MRFQKSCIPNVQTYFTFNADSAKSNVLTNCLRAIENWLSLSKSKLNKSETQCIVFNRQVSKFVEDVCGNDFCDVSAVRCVKNLDVFLDCDRYVEEQVNSPIKKCYFQILNVGKMRQYNV